MYNILLGSITDELKNSIQMLVDYFNRVFHEEERKHNKNSNRSRI